MHYLYTQSLETQTKRTDASTDVFCLHDIGYNFVLYSGPTFWHETIVQNRLLACFCIPIHYISQTVKEIPYTCFTIVTNLHTTYNAY